MRITIDQPTIAAAGVFERVIVTSIPEPGHYAMLQTGLGLMSILAYGQRGGIDATSLVVDANSPYNASTRRPLKGPDVFFSASEHDIGHLPKQQTVNAVPEPSSIVLATIGLLALFTRRSRKGAPRPRLPLGYFYLAHTA